MNQSLNSKILPSLIAKYVLFSINQSDDCQTLMLEAQIYQIDLISHLSNATLIQYRLILIPINCIYNLEL
jgi:hypothetical protein